jgi:primosomal protein N'
MTKKETSKLHTAIAKWDDTVTEKEVMEKFEVSDDTLRKMRKQGIIKTFRHVTPAKPGNAGRPGKKLVYSLIEITDLFCPQQPS